MRRSDGAQLEGSLPAEVIAAMNYLRAEWKKTRFFVGLATNKACFSHIHLDDPEDDPTEFIGSVMRFRGRFESGAWARCIEMVKPQTPSYIFRAYFDLYLSAAESQALEIFNEILAMGRANQSSIVHPAPEWATAKIEDMVRGEKHTIGSWIRSACDGDASSKFELGKSAAALWESPKFLEMVPVHRFPYDASTVWERLEPSRSASVVSSLTEEFELRIGLVVGQSAGKAMVQYAKESTAVPPRIGAAVSDDDNALEKSSAGSIDAPMTRASGQAKGRPKGANSERNAVWEKTFDDLRASYPGHTLSWYYKRIASDRRVSCGKDATTIRKILTRQK